MQDIIANGLSSIRVGLEDFERAADSGRLTSAVRNVYAGILILAKGKLYDMSPSGSQGVLTHHKRATGSRGPTRTMADFCGFQ